MGKIKFKLCGLLLTQQNQVFMESMSLVRSCLKFVESILCQLFEWKEFGFRMEVPDGSSKLCDIYVNTIIAGEFTFPENTELVSALYAISSSKTLENPVKIEMEHCVMLEKEEECKYLCFGIAKCDRTSTPYTFEILEGGIFTPQSKFGKICRKFFSIIGIFKHAIDFIWRCVSFFLPRTSSSQQESDSTQRSSQSDQHSSLNGTSQQEPHPVQLSPSPQPNHPSHYFQQEPGSTPSHMPSFQPEPQSALSHSPSSQSAPLLGISSHSEADDYENMVSGIDDLSLYDATTSSSTFTDESSPGQGTMYPNNMYTAYFLLKECRPRKFSWKFAVVKDIQALNTHVMGTHDDWELKSYFKFSFVSDSVELNLGQIVQSDGWTISPEMYPCEILQVDVDRFWASSLVPCCSVSIIAGHRAAESLYHPVEIRNTCPKRQVQIICFLSSDNQTSVDTETPQVAAVAQDDNLHRAPDIEELLNFVAAKALNKWKMVGINLSITQDRLSCIEERYHSNEDRYLEVFQQWRSNNNHPYTWITIISVLKAPIVQEMQLANELEEMLTSI